MSVTARNQNFSFEDLFSCCLANTAQGSCPVIFHAETLLEIKCH